MVFKARAIPAREFIPFLAMNSSNSVNLIREHSGNRELGTEKTYLYFKLLMIISNTISWTSSVVVKELK